MTKPAAVENVTFKELNCVSAKTEKMEKLEALARKSLAEGLSCLSTYGRSEDVNNLLRITNKPVTLSCHQMDSDVVAKASAMDDKNFPGIELNPETYFDDVQVPAGAIFHEALHWLGYRHFLGVDVPYLAEVCCFEKNNDLQKLACKMLADKQILWTDPEYIRNFTKVLKEYGLARVGLRTAWKATKKLNGKFSNELISFIFVHASLPQLSSKFKTEAEQFLSEKRSSCFISKKNPKLEFAKSFGDAVAGVLQSDSHQVDQAWQKLESVSPQVCKSMSKDEKQQLSNAAQIIALRLLEMRPIVDSVTLLKLDTICKN